MKLNALILSLGLVAGCVGHLEFEPRPDAGGGSGGASGGSPISGNNTIPNNNNNNGGGSGGAQGGYGTGGQAPPDNGGYPTASGGSTGSTVADAGNPGTDGGAASGDAVVTAAAVCPTGVNVLTDIFAAKCGACHGAAAPTKNLDMVTTGLGARMVNKTSTCKSQPLIAGMLVAGKPAGLLFQKLAGAVAGCGVQMPAGASPLTAAEMACVNDWAVAAIAKVTGGK